MVAGGGGVEGSGGGDAAALAGQTATVPKVSGIVIVHVVILRIGRDGGVQ